MALFASFGQPQSFTEKSFLPSSDNPENVCETKQPGFNCLNSHTMKRKRVPDEPDQPGAKRKHYEDRMAYRLNSLDLGSEAQTPKEDESSEDEMYIREIDPEDLDESPVTFYLNEDSPQPIVEEPEEEEDPDNFVISDELRQIMNAAKKERILPNLLPTSSGRELVIWRPPARLGYTSEDSEDTNINSRIQEVIDEDVEFADLSNDVDSVPMDDGSGEITFPEDSSSSRSSTSPPLNPLNSSIDTRNGYQSSSSTSSSEGNLTFRLRQTSGSNPTPEATQPTGEEPMDLD